MTTTSTDRDAALARLRGIVKPGATLYVSERFSRTRETVRVELRVVSPGPLQWGELVPVGADMATVLHRSLNARDGRVMFGADYRLTDVLDSLSVTLFGKPGLIRGETL